MKKVVITGERQAELVEVPDPQPKEDWAVVKVHATPMCTEYKAWMGGYKQEYLGHEAAGEVVAVAQPSRVAVGDRVVVMPQYPCGKCALCVSGEYIHCQNTYDVVDFLGTREGTATYAQYVVKPAWILPRIPDNVSYEHAGVALCGLGPSFGAMQTMGVSAYDTIMITGLGPVGLGGVVNARFRGARVIGVDLVEWRANRAKELGADAALDPRDDDIVDQIMDLTGGIGVDYALDCSGNVNAERLCIDATRRKGKVAYVGECRDDLAIRISPDMIRKGLTLIGSWHYNAKYYWPIMKVIQESPLIDTLISDVMPMSNVQDAFELQSTGQCAKVILQPWA